MPTVPHNELYHQLTTEQLSKFSEYTSIINECVNHGTILLAKYIQGKTLDIEEMSVISLFRQNLELMNGIAQLISNGSTESLKISLRAHLEVSWQLSYLLQSNLSRNAESFMVVDLHNRIIFLEKLETGSNRNLQLNASLRRDHRLNENLLVMDQAEITRRKTECNVLLQNTRYSNTEIEYQRLRTLPTASISNPSWYNLFSGPRNIEGLANSVGESGTYDILYRHYSGAVHGTSALSNVTSQNILTKINSGENIETLVKHAINQIIHCSDIFAEKALGTDTEIEIHNQWYLTEIFQKRRQANV
ncbi:DUF5677 domain-containing protein [Leptospira wolffii]|uniref:DUF5677 domain-containing protein n=1 Tax=Leptospira wolffii TaxID=409998 RepID=A0ABV5BTM5_9LEPT